MYQRRTVFIVGAGASAELDFPLGNQLKGIISNATDIRYRDGYSLKSGDGDIVDAIRQHCRMNGIADANPYYYAGREIAAALPLAISIDNYLEAHAGNDRIELLGKLAIAKAILDSERNTPMYRKHDQGSVAFDQLQKSWLVPLARTLTEGVVKSDAACTFQHVAFVIFNYDRSVEVFLWNALQTYYGIGSDAATKILSEARFHHPYGTVGQLPWQTGEAPQSFFGQDVTPQGLLDIAAGILTFSEQVASERRATMLADIEAAETVVFLGFGFLEQNMRLLQAEAPTQARRVYATAKGLSVSDCDIVTHGIRQMLRQDGLPVDLQNQLTAAALFSEYSKSITQRTP
ncbi:MAG: hypothetical protein WBW32_03850 [Luteibacter sp.]